MSRDNFKTKMPATPRRQKHGEPHTEDNYGFLASLHGNECADINARLVWTDPAKHKESAGFHIIGAHGETAASCGYVGIMHGKVCEPMSHDQLHRPLTKWPAEVVLNDWRRGRSKNSPRPKTIASLYGYMTRNGGTGVVELKGREMRLDWVMQHMVEVAASHNVPPWFKALYNMAYFREKAQATTDAAVDGIHGQFAGVAGNHIHGRQARLVTVRGAMENWPPELRAAVRIW